jgi:hypothetical protein
MDVVHFVLRVVVLHQKPRPVQPEVMRVTRLDGAGPGEADRAEPRLADPGPLRLRELGPEVPDEFLDQPLCQHALPRPHVAEWQPDRAPQSIGAAGAGDDATTACRAGR